MLLDASAPPPRLTLPMRSVLDRMARAGRPPLHTLPAAEARAAYEAGAGVLEIPKAALPRVEDLQIPARDGTALAARLYAPSSDAGLPLLLYLHGGGFTIGSIDTHDVLCTSQVIHTGRRTLVVEAEVYQGERLVAKAQGTFAVL